MQIKTYHHETTMHEIISSSISLLSSLIKDQQAQKEICGYTQQDKQNARTAVDTLCRYKRMYGNFTERHLSSHPLVSEVMQRYQFRDIHELNQWLDNML